MSTSGSSSPVLRNQARMVAAEALYQSPNALAGHYAEFKVSERLLLTGHSHQAWPDCSFEGQREAWLDAARNVDEKWERAYAKAEDVRRGFARLMDDTDGCYALASSTHDLFVRFLSALPLRRRPRFVTTDGEFHSVRRQLDRLVEEGLEIVKVPGLPARSVAGRLADAVTERTAAVIVSSVFYESAHIAPNLGQVLDACRNVGAELLVDAYHSLNVVPFSLEAEHLREAFVVGGGYKYCQLGEGNCFLRFPRQCTLRPAVTGWFSEFETLANGEGDGVVYGAGGARFAGATYDPTSHYRAARVFDFFREQNLTAEFLREVNQHQVRLLIQAFDELDPDPQLIARDRSVKLEGIGGFLALTSPHAGDICRRLHEDGVFADYRDHTLRLGPAPYLSDHQLAEAMGKLGKVVRSLSRG